MIIIEGTTIYKCEHCRKIYQLERFAVHHEKMCSKNPDNARRCFGCKFMSKKETTIIDDRYSYEHEVRIGLMYCSKLESYMYPPIVEHKGNAIELGDESNQPMKRECELYEEPEYS